MCGAHALQADSRILRVVSTPAGGFAVRTEAEGLINDAQPDIVVFGHSHIAGCERHNGVWYINPGSAGPAR